MKILNRLGLRRQSAGVKASEPSGEVTITIVNGQPAFQLERLQRWSDLKPIRRQAPVWFSIVVALAMLVQPTTVTAAPYSATQIISLANAAREDHGVEKLRMDDRLMEAAYAKANDILAKGYFSHTSPSGDTTRTWVMKFGYAYTEAGENLAMDFIVASEVINRWLGSSTHRQNLLSAKYSDTGVAVLEGTMNGQSTIIVVQFFGNQRANSTPAPISEPTPTPPETVNNPSPVTSTGNTGPASTQPPIEPVSIRVSSILNPDGVPPPNLTFTLQAPNPELLIARTPNPRVEGVQNQVQVTSLPRLSPLVRANLPVLYLIVFLVDFLAITAFGLFRTRWKFAYPTTTLGFTIRPILN